MQKKKSIADPDLPDDGRKPLAGLCVMVTRADSPQDDPLAVRLRELGAEVVAQPAIRIGPPADWAAVDRAIAQWRQYDWLVFLSANGVRYFLERAAAGGFNFGAGQTDDCPVGGAPRLAAIGPGTAEELARHGLQADLMPKQYRAESLVEALAPTAAGRRFLIARASRGRETLAEGLRAAGAAAVDQVAVYTSSDVDRPDAEIARRLHGGEIAWVTVTSSAIARSLYALFGDDLRRARLASISPLTSGVLRELGLAPSVEASEYTLEGLAAAMARRPINEPRNLGNMNMGTTE